MPSNVLVVEDDADIAASIAELLREDGYHAETTASGLDAVVRIARTPFDVVLLDLQIHDLSGEGVLRVVSDLATRTAVIVMSAQPRGWQADAFRHGATACVEKP